MITIVSLLYGQNWTEDAGKSLLDNLSAQDRLVFVNNGRPQLLNKFRKKITHHPRRRQVAFIQNSRNLGFAAGCNLGIKYALRDKTDAVLLINQDAILETNCLANLRDRTAEVLSPLIRFRRNQRWLYDHGGKIIWPLGRTFHRESYRPRLKSTPDYVSGCAMFIQSKVFQEIGLFDERFFLYFEDVDFCLRAKQAGFRVAVCPEAIVTHFIKEKSVKPLWQQWQLLKSNLQFIHKWLPLYWQPLAVGYWLFLGCKVFLNWAKVKSCKYLVNFLAPEPKNKTIGDFPTNKLTDLS